MKTTTQAQLSPRLQGSLKVAPPDVHALASARQICPHESFQAGVDHLRDVFGDLRPRRALRVFDAQPRQPLDQYAIETEERDNRTTTYGMHCPDLRALGNWLLDAKPILTSGLTWYLPSYSLGQYETVRGIRRDQPFQRTEQVKAIDYLTKDGRAVDASGAEPIKSALVRPVLRTELPFLEGVSLRDFSEITAGEFNSYVAFRDFLRRSLLDLDEALDDTQSERAMTKLGLQINDELRAMGTQLDSVRRKRAVAATGAVLGSVGTILVAVYGPALATVVAAAGVSGGVWGIVNTMAENNYRSLRENKWYYVWALAKKSATQL